MLGVTPHIYSIEGRQELAPVKAFKCKSPTASGRELHDACKGPSGKEQRKGTRSVANLVNFIQDSLTCLQLAVFSQSGIYLDKITLCLSASSNSQSNSQFNSQSISPARWFVYVIHSPFFLQSAHFVPSKTFSRNKTHLKTHLVQLKTFIWNEIVSGRRARLRLSAFLPGTWLMLHHRTRRIQDCCCSPRRLHRRYLESRGCRQVAHHHPGACRKGIMKRHVLVNGFDHICGK